MNQLLETLQAHSRCIAFTGAGVSTLSGIPDFRGKLGIYTTLDVNRLFDHEYFLDDPSYFYHKSKDFIYNLDSKEPSIVHKTLATLENKGIIKGVITQNIDQLHFRAGSKNVYELHGSAKTHTCLSCKKKYRFNEIAPIVKKDIVPRCLVCNNIIKPDIVFYGEILNSTVLNGAIREAENADLMIVCGTSLVVQPAASIPMVTFENGGEIIMVNDSPTYIDRRAILRYDSLEDTFRMLWDEISGL